MDAILSQAAVDVDEVVYTSAPKLLNGGANLGVVAATKSFPSELDRLLRPLRAYSTPRELASHLQGKPGEIFILSPVACGETGYIAFTRATYSSVAHLGRTTPIVQHVAVASSRLDAAGLRVADLIGWVAGLPGFDPPFTFLANWQGDPQQLEPRKLSQSSAPLAPAAIVHSLSFADAIQQRLLAAICEIVNIVLDASEPQRSAFLVVPVDWQPHVPAILAAVLSVLPSRVQKTLTAVSQAWEMSDVRSGPRLVITHPGSPLVVTMSRPAYASKAAVIDVSKEAVPAGSQAEPGSRIVPADLTSWSCERSPSLPELFDELDPLGKHAPSVLALKRSLNHWLDSLAPAALAEAQAAATACDASIGSGGKVPASAGGPLLRAIEVGCRQLINQARWQDLLLLLDAQGLSAESSGVIEMCVSANIDQITEHAAESVARMSMACPGMERLLSRAGRSEHFLKYWLAAMDAYVKEFPDRIGETAQRYSRLMGAPLLRAAWQRLRSVGLVPHAAATFTTAVLEVLIERVGRASHSKDEARSLPSQSVPPSGNIVPEQVKS